MSIDFEARATQELTWNTLDITMFRAFKEAIPAAQALLPTDDPVEQKVRDGIIMAQLHMIIAGMLGIIEGAIARTSMTPMPEILERRQEYIEEGSVNGPKGIWANKT